MSQKTPIVALIRRVLNLYRVRVSVHGIENAFYNHPDYPSLKSISDVFDQWGVKHVVAYFSLENLVTLNAPFIAPLKTNEYVWVDQINDTKLKYWSEINGKKVVSHKDFNKVWSGIALIIGSVLN